MTAYYACDGWPGPSYEISHEEFLKRTLKQPEKLPGPYVALFTPYVDHEMDVDSRHYAEDDDNQDE